MAAPGFSFIFVTLCLNSMFKDALNFWFVVLV